MTLIFVHVATFKRYSRTCKLRMYTSAMCWDLSSMYFMAFMARPARVASKNDRPQALLLVSRVLDGTNFNMA